jgi:hypothetical protein
VIKKIIVAGSAAAAILGAGTAALALSGTATPSAAGASDTSGAAAAGGAGATPGAAGAAGAQSAAGGPRRRDVDRLRRALHAEWVTRNRAAGTFVTHDAIRGSVGAVSPTAITVQAADGVSQTYAVNAGTTVRVRQDKKAASA